MPDLASIPHPYQTFASLPVLPPPYQRIASLPIPDDLMYRLTMQPISSSSGSDRSNALSVLGAILLAGLFLP